MKGTRLDSGRADDDAALADCLSGDVLCSLYAPRLRRYIEQFGLSDHDADDAVQETLVRFLTVLNDEEKQLSSVGGWLFATARNVCRDVYRARGRCPVDLDGVADPSGPEARSAAETTELGAALRYSIDSLPESLRAVFVLRHLQSESYARIASRLGMTENAVGTRLLRARRLLRRWLNDWM